MTTIIDEVYRRDSPPSSENFTAELTRSNSGGESSITVENFKDDLLHSGNATTDNCTEWTNERHHTFLGCLEASFVEQLHKSIVLRAGCVEQNRSCRSVNNDKATKQLTALQDGCGKKIGTDSSQPILLVRHGHEYLDLQLCSRLYSDEKQRTDKRTSSRELQERSNLLLPISAELHESVSRISEGSGQNFVDEETEENTSSKRLKITSTETADDEQIVPTGKFGSSGLLQTP